MVQNNSYHHHDEKETVNGGVGGTSSSLAYVDGLVRVNDYYPATTNNNTGASSYIPPRIPIPRLFSRSIDTLTQQQQQQGGTGPTRNNNNRPSTLVPTTSHSDSTTGSSHPSDCRRERRNTVTSQSSSSSSGLIIVHPSTLSYDDDDDNTTRSSDHRQSRNPENSIGTIERNHHQQHTAVVGGLLLKKDPPSSPPQPLYSSSRIRSTNMRPPLEEEEEGYEPNLNNEQSHHPTATNTNTNTNTNTTTSYHPRGSIRDVTHSWDRDVPNFPIHEIQRMKHKTDRLRTNRNITISTTTATGSSINNAPLPHHSTDGTVPPPPSSSSINNNNNNDDTSGSMEIIRTTVSGSSHLPRNGQSVRTSSTSHRNSATPPPPPTSAKYHQHWASLSNWNSTTTGTSTKNTTSNGRRGSKDSLSDVLGSKLSCRVDTTQLPITTTSSFGVVEEDTTTRSSSSGGGGGISTMNGSHNASDAEPNPFVSVAAVEAEHRLRRDFHQSRATPSPSPTTKGKKNTHVNTSSETENSHTSQNDDTTDEPDLILHDLCGEAVSTEDIAWRNALSVLAAQPELASIVDPIQIWTPLHICCLGITPPPTYIVRALLYTYPKATCLPDDGGRLTLHLVAASSADVDIMQMIVQDNPTAIYHRDDHGLTPLHLYIRNRTVPLTLQHVKILLGYTIVDSKDCTTTRRHVRQRRGDHLQMSVQSVDQWLLQRKCRPITNLHHNTMIHEQYFDTFPMDVQVSLRQLSQWKHSNTNDNHDDIESVEVQLTHTSENKNNHIDEIDMNDDVPTFDTTNPAAIPLPKATQYPLHMIVQRMIIEEAFVPVDSVIAATTGIPKGNEGSDHRNKTFPTSVRNSTRQNDTSEEDDDDDEEEINASNEQELSRPNQTSSILRLFAAAFSEALVKRDKNGCTPLLQVMQIRDSFPSVDIVEILIGKRNATGFEALPSWAHNLPTHTLLMNGSSSSDQKRYMNPAMIAVSETGQLPLHIAAEEAPTDSILMQTIYECYPAAVLVQDGRGRTPLHLSFHNYRRIVPDQKVIEILYTDRVANTMDDYGKIPFDLLVEHAHLLPWQKPQNSRDASSSIYQKLFKSSMAGAAHPTTSSEVKNFLPRLRTLPPWLRIEACSVQFVQDLIVDELVSPWKCATILFDGVLLFTLIIVFRLQMKEFIDQLYDDSHVAAWYTYAVYATAVGRFMARILFAYFATTIGEFRHLCLFNIWYWIDVWAMLMSIVTSIFLYGNISDERLLVMGTATTILLWLSLVGYLSSWWYNMAVFTGGFLKIINFITSPLLTAGILVIAFAQCFYTLLQLDCVSAMATTPVCSVRDAYRVVYMLIRGESLVDSTGINEFSVHAIILLASFLALLAIYLLAVLVTVLMASSMLDFEHIALHSYWEPVLGFILSTGTIVNEKDTISQKRTFEVKKAYLWDMLTQTLFGGVPRMENGLFVYPLRSYFVTFIIAVFFVPIWFVFGLVSLGLLWPPQLRRCLFRLPTMNILSRSQSPSSEQSRTQLAEVQNEILQMKCMSYERSQTMEKEMREMKELLIMAMQD